MSILTPFTLHIVRCPSKRHHFRCHTRRTYASCILLLTPHICIVYTNIEDAQCALCKVLFTTFHDAHCTSSILKHNVCIVDTKVSETTPFSLVLTRVSSHFFFIWKKPYDFHDGTEVLSFGPVHDSSLFALKNQLK